MALDNLKRVDVALDQKAYPIFIGNNFLNQIGTLIQPYVRSEKIFIVSDDLVSTLYFPCVAESLEEAGFDVYDVIIPQGESSKSLQQAEKMLEHILKIGCDRQCAIVSLGGGVVGDLAGFCASVLLRGIDFIQIPTTLLAQSDSSVGGKTGVNSHIGKNLIGTFHQPKAVFIDVDTLDTLDPQQVLAGFAEVVKYGLALNADFWSWLIENGERVIALDKKACVYAVEQSCRIKAAVVSQDQFEQTGLRSLLNLGHTFAHAIEAANGMNGSILHGEAVSIGCVLAAWMSADLELCRYDIAERIAQQYEKWELPTKYEYLKAANLVSLMKKDKKSVADHLNLVLLEGIGNAVLVNDIDPDDVERVLNEKGRKKHFISSYQI